MGQVTRFAPQVPYCAGGQVGARAPLDTLEKTRIYCLCLESNHLSAESEENKGKKPQAG
jgi:hypothetical protein